MAGPEVVMYVSSWCPYCVRAKAILQRKGVQWREVNIETDPSLRQHMIETTGRRTVPQIFIGDHHVGGSDDLAAAERSGELDRLLAASPRG
jgi:glutaredoxin 3